MANERLPIKLFDKRGDQDERRTEGGGSNTLPPWVLSEAELLVKATEIQQVLEETAQIIASRPPEREFIPAVVKVSFREEALSKGARSEVGRLFNRKNEYNFIGIIEDLDFLIKVESSEHLDFITRNLQKPKSFPVSLSAITEIETFRPAIEIPLDTNDNLKIKLVNYQDRRLNESVERVFEQTLTELGVDLVRKTRYSADITVFNVRNVEADALVHIQDFEALYSITSMPKYSLGLDDGGPGTVVPVKEPVPGQTYPVIGILDSGIASIPHIAPWIDSRRFTAYEEGDVDREHGTFVTGIALYSDELEDEQWVGAGACKILDATVFPRRGVFIDEDELYENIQRAIRQYPDVKVWNLSLGSRVECDSQDFSDFGKALDSIQERFNVLICKSAGNCENFKKFQPKSRISASADSVRALVVGSMTHRKDQYDLAPEGYPSPFSRIGFGPNNLVKPDVTHFGGNGGLRPDGTATYTGVNSFSTSGSVLQRSGTSFSTPRVTALVGALSHRLAEEFDPLMLKALVIHSAKYPAHLDLEPTDRLKEMGYGRPGSVEEIIYNSSHEVTLILRDTIIRGGYIEILDFPFPPELVNEDGEYYGEIVATLVTGTRLDGSQGSEYCQSNIEVSLGTYDSVRERDTKVATILNPVGTENPCNVLLPSNYSQRFQKYVDDSFTPERQLRRYSGKFHPVKKYAVNLSEMTPAKRRTGLNAPKQWFLRLKGLFTQAAEMIADADGEELSQDFTLVVTIRDPLQQHDVYSSVTRSLTNNNFQHSNVRLRDEIRINLRNSFDDLDS
ncbi:S8 family peptidase [Fibrivirga algicola]|uniref:S8 family peptidase n=1 Tax=Fibrivirga algicola TaxID=2950420 RepID=A0ABX0QDZ6_9BACT|nr:S8 family peptidase [Fibrivirga algicola]NID10644.1 S8 family peptidase [Fibrivirga algicola]